MKLTATELLQLLSLVQQLGLRIDKIARQTEEDAPEVWAEVKDHFNAAADQWLNPPVSGQE